MSSARHYKAVSEKEQYQKLYFFNVKAIVNYSKYQYDTPIITQKMIVKT